MAASPKLKDFEQTGEMFHMGIAKELLAKLVAAPGDGWKEVVPAAKTREQAAAAVDAIPTPIFCDCACVKDADGACTGKKAD